MQMKLADQLDGPGAEVLRRGTDMIVGQVTAMKRMVDDFREYARTPPAVLQSIDLAALIHEILGLYETSATPVTLRLGEGLPRVLGDPAQLRQVVHNLLQNAQDAVHGRPEPLIVLETVAIAQGIRMTISDNGAGFAQKIIARAFEPYATTKPRGTGLGLAIVKKIVDDHHGTIELANAASGGAVVSITLNAAPQEATSNVSAEPATAAPVPSSQITA